MSEKDTHTHIERTEKSGSGGLAFIVGGLVVAVAVIAWVIFGGGDGAEGDVNISVEGGGEALESAAESAGEAAESAAGAAENAAESAADSAESAADAVESGAENN